MTQKKSWPNKKTKNKNKNKNKYIYILHLPQDLL